MGLNNDANLVLHSKLNETAGTSAIDASGNGNTGTLSGAGYSFANDAVTGKFGGGLGHAVDTDIVTIPAFAPGDVDQTIAFYFKCAVDTAFYIVATRDAAAGHLSVRRASALQFQSYIGADGKVTSNDMVALNDGNWHHVAIVHDATGNTLSWYYDGGLNKAAAAATGTWTSGKDTTLYARTGDGTTVAAALDDVRIYSRVLSANEIRQLAQNPYNAIDQGITASISPSIAYSPATTSL